MKLPVRNLKGEMVGEVEVSDYLFAQPMNGPAVHQAMIAQLANARQGTHKVKTRGEVSGGGRKPWGQKHTGRSRQGSTRAPHWRHGGIVFGPQPRSYRQRIPRKMRRLALRCLLSDKVRQEVLVLLEELSLPGSRTKEMVALLDTLKIEGTALVVTAGSDPVVVKAARNLQGVRTLPAQNLNVVDLLNHRQVVMTLPALRRAEELWGPPSAPVVAASALLEA